MHDQERRLAGGVDALRELVEAVEREYCSEDTERLEPDDAKVSYPENRCHITFGMIRRAKAAIAAGALKDAERWRACAESGFPHHRDGAGFFIPGSGLGYYHTKEIAADALVAAHHG